MTEKKLKVMHEVKPAQTETTDIPKLKEAKAEAKTETKNSELLEKGIAALRELGGSATSPKLVEKLGFGGETRRDRARRLMEELIEQKRVRKSKQHATTEVARKGEYVYQLLEAAA